MGKYLVAATPLFFFCALNAQASELDYTYLELRIADTEIGNLDGTGLRFNGSFNVTEQWLLVGGVTTTDFGSGVDVTTLELGAGYIYRYRPSFDLVGYGKIVSVDADFPGGSDSETGIALVGGIRGLFTPQFEGRATVNYVNVDSADTYLEFGGDYHFNQSFSAGLTIEVGGDADSFTIGARWFFQ